MKLKIQKNTLMNLSDDATQLPLGLTPQIAAGRGFPSEFGCTGNFDCNTVSQFNCNTLNECGPSYAVACITYPCNTVEC